MQYLLLGMCSELVYSAVHATICYIWTGLEVNILETKSQKYARPEDYKPVFFCVLGCQIQI